MSDHEQKKKYCWVVDVDLDDNVTFTQRQRHEASSKVVEAVITDASLVRKSRLDDLSGYKSGITLINNSGGNMDAASVRRSRLDDHADNKLGIVVTNNSSDNRVIIYKG